MTDVIVLSKKQAEKISPDGFSAVVISITGVGEFDDNLAKLSPKFSGILRLQFDDVEKPEPRYYPMVEDDAKKIVTFVNQWWGKVPFIIVHCLAGISRSSGVSAAILKAKTGSDEEIFTNQAYYPNRHCYRLVLNEFERVNGIICLDNCLPKSLDKNS